MSATKGPAIPGRSPSARRSRARATGYVVIVARRLPGHDAVRGESLEVRIADTTVRAFADESIAAAALASGARVLSRSLKYHRPRTFFCLEGHCSGCLVRLSGVPNMRACQAPCTPGAEAQGQNAFPSAEVDLLGAVDFLFSRGMAVGVTLYALAAVLLFLSFVLAVSMVGIILVPLVFLGAVGLFPLARHVDHGRHAPTARP